MDNVRFQTLIMERLMLLERRMERLEEQRLPDSSLAAVAAMAATKVEAHWLAMKTPLEAQALSRVFNRRARSVGGMDIVLAEMLRQGSVTELRRTSGARLFLPTDIAMKLSPDALIRFKTGKTPEAAKATELAFPELTAEEQAEIDALAEQAAASITKKEAL